MGKQTDIATNLGYYSPSKYHLYKAKITLLKIIIVVNGLKQVSGKQ
ncbi:hypothetical protein [Methanobrevibacter arboriphilus]|nr:hypothetical protein [Methanobrevibacter arboriphilus]